MPRLPKTNWSDPRSRIAGTDFRVGEVLARSGYRSMPRGPRRVGPYVVLRPRTNVRDLALMLQALRDGINAERRRRGLPETGIRILSWARSWEKNVAVGGARRSQHLFFNACDISREEIRRLCPWKGGAAWFDRLADRVFARDGFGQYPGGSRHVDNRGYRARWSSW